MPKNRSAKWFNFVNKDNGARFELYLYGMIVENGWKWDDTDITPNDFKEELAKTEGAKNLDIFINSPGGHIFAGLTIYHMIKRHPADVTAYIDGISASITNVITMAADKIIMPKTSLMLAHKPLFGVMGYFNADDFLSFVMELNKLEVPISEAYQARTGLSAKEIAKILAKDEFMTAEQAVELGFADEFGGEKPAEASLNGDILTLNGVDIDLKNFKNFPKNRFPSGGPAPVDASSPTMTPSAAPAPASPASVDAAAPAPTGKTIDLKQKLDFYRAKITYNSN
jgi:ATP-dependent Clp protease protease subunit